MNICILDPASQIPSLTLLFPNAEYYAHEQTDDFTYYGQYSQQQNLEKYGFKYRTDWETINSNTYDCLFISVTLSDYYNPLSPILINSFFNLGS